MQSILNRGMFMPFLVVFIGLVGCSPKAQDQVVASLGNKSITLGEYEQMFLKSSGSKEQAAQTTREEREKFLDLMTKFKLKISDAYDKGLDKRPEIKHEIGQYKGSLVASFLTDRNITNNGIKQLYKRRTEEIRASHILLPLAGYDSAQTYQTAYAIIQRLKAGAPFDSLANVFSTDPSVGQNHGDLYYFTSGQMVPEFEDAAYAMKVGEVSSHPIKTQFGLHIIKVTDRKPAPGEVQCSHIMIRFEQQDPTPEDTLQALAKISMVRDSIAAGHDFAELAKRNSADPGSAGRGGDLGWFSRRRWIQPFDEVAMTLKPGQVSGIVRTVYGYHLIKCYDARPPKSFEDSKKDIQQVYQQTRFQSDYNKFLAGLKTQLRFKVNEDVMTQFYGALDTNKTTRDSAWTSGITSELGSSPMFLFGERAVSVDSVITLIKERPEAFNIPLRRAGISPVIEKIAEQLVFQVRGETIEKEYPEFASMLQEYVDGILLYQVEQENVWNKVAINDTILRAYFDENRSKFTYPDRVDFSSIMVYNEQVAQEVDRLLKAGKSFNEIAVLDSLRMMKPSKRFVGFSAGSAVLSAKAKNVLDSIAADMSSDDILRLQLIAHPDTTKQKAKNLSLAEARIAAIRAHMSTKMDQAETKLNTTTRAIAKGSPAMPDAEFKSLASRIDLEVVSRRPWIIGKIEHHLVPIDTDDRSKHADKLMVGQYSEPFGFKNGQVIVRLNGREASRHKTFEEAGTEVSTSYQEYESKRLEREWLEGLKRRYPVVEHKDVLDNAFRNGN